MPLVSKRVLNKSVEDKMYNTLWESFALLKSKSDIKFFLEDLLSSVERKMIAKRLAIAALLLHGYKYESIKDILKVSRETIATVSLALENNKGYKVTINKIASSESAKDFWKSILKAAHRIGVTQDTFKSDEYLNKKFGFDRKTLV